MAKKPIFNLKNRIEDPALVVMVFNFKGRRIVLSTGLKIPQKFWNDAKDVQRVRASRDFPRHKKFNQRINLFEAETIKLWDEYQARGILPTAKEFKSELSNRINDTHQVAPSLLPFIQQVIEERQRMNKPAGSIQIYKNCLKNLETYQKERKQKLSFDNLSQSFVNDFTAFLFARKNPLGENLSDSYVHKVLTTLKMFVRLADDRGVFEGCPLLKAKLGVKKRERDNIYLTEAEIHILYNLELTSKLANVRDLFLIGCLTGLRFSDYSVIKPENLQTVEHGEKQVQCLVMTTKKTEQKVVLPLVNPMLLTILERHNWKAPKRISNQRLNDYLKDLGKLAGFTQEVQINEYKAGKRHKRTRQKWELMTTHTARRSFATNAYKRGLPAGDIMKFTGHTTVASFMKYIKVTTEETAVLLSEHDFFTGKAPLRAVK
ncbi:MAG: site-specific integrase [Saprospiraceae bacterium]|nr:site-specific integrase [Saprospiraceae bacterium]